jgi:hypothetical protein
MLSDTEKPTKVLGTFPRFMTFLVAFSLATRILCLDGIVDVEVLT